MKFVFGIVALLAHATLARAAEDFPKYTLETENYVVEISPRCAEGDVSCDRVTYRGTNRKTGAVLELRGGVTVHTTCADGETPCRFVGYRFRSGRHSYFVGEDLDGVSGTLSVRKDGKVLLLERGKWK